MTTQQKPKNIAIAYLLLMILPGLNRLYLQVPQWWIFLAIIFAQLIFILAGLTPLLWAAAVAYIGLFFYDILRMPEWHRNANS